MVMREMSTRYSRGTGGYFWAIAGPVASIAIMSFVFAQMFRHPSIGTSFIVFYTSGYIPFHMYSDVQGPVATAARFNRALMQYPAVTPMDAVLSRAFLSVMTLALIDTIVLTGVLTFGETPTNLDVVQVTLALAGAALVGIGIGSINCVAVAFYPTWDRLWRLATAPLFVISGILYTFNEMPPSIQALLWWNPLIHSVGLMRGGIYGAYNDSYTSHIYLFGVGGTLVLVGLYLVRRHRNRIMNPRF